MAKCCKCLYYSFCALLVFFTIGFFIFLLIFLPQDLKFTVTEASLTKFDNIAAPNNTLYYNLTLNVTVRNPNKRIGIYFQRVRVISHYQKKIFSQVNLNTTAPFYQGHKNTTVFPATIQGQQLLPLELKDEKQYNSETDLGIYNVDVKLALRVRVRYGKIKSMNFKPPQIECKLEIPLSNSNGTSSKNFSFRATKCGNVYILRNRVSY